MIFHFLSTNINHSHINEKKLGNVCIVPRSRVSSGKQTLKIVWHKKITSEKKR